MQRGELTNNNIIPEEHGDGANLQKQIYNDNYAHINFLTDRIYQELVEDDTLLNYQVIFIKGDRTQKNGEVINIKSDADGNFIEHQHGNTI